VPQQLNAIPSNHHLQQHQQKQQQEQHYHHHHSNSIELTDIPPPRELDLSAIPKPDSLKLDEIRVPPVVQLTLAGSTIKIPSSRNHLIELVAANGDSYEENLVNQCTRNDLSPAIR